MGELAQEQELGAVCFICETGRGLDSGDTPHAACGAVITERHSSPGLHSGVVSKVLEGQLLVQDFTPACAHVRPLLRCALETHVLPQGSRCCLPLILLL